MEYNYTAFDEISHYNGSSQKSTASFYTPEVLIKKMCESITSYSGKTFFDPTCGEGGILAYVLRRKLEEGEDLNDALTEIYGVELDSETFSRLLFRFRKFATDNGASLSAIKIMNSHFKLHDILTFEEFDCD